MDISTQFSGATASQGAAGAARARMVSSDFETFLRMLTTQMQNQDPLNPMEASDFAVQLATFSGVEQSVRTNQLLEEMMGRSAMSELAGLVGKTVRSAGPAYFNGDSLGLSLPAMPDADSARLVVRDNLGGIVDTVDVPTSGGAVEWRGLGADGLPLPSGTYRFEMLGYAAGVLADTGTVEAYGEVIEARNDGGITTVVLSGGRAVPLDEVSAVRGPVLR
ncbi:flagellar hook capping FlgD N-terminal domain-containing protein [Rhodobaculum claviforme]|uniref:Basal-body rod modification protein FlgD n=1 Tax=Rhodobaculum claviforme TaxID=1549854 RepID=A0A934TLY4_9RHOB|nr:flagellar hook capping FlgD N-terminal domain-containing protein [Rhodobaculum claviforme]MBK5928564.1 hypothetical protein [Rhodobaculum claviforme]